MSMQGLPNEYFTIKGNEENPQKMIFWRFSKKLWTNS